MKPVNRYATRMTVNAWLWLLGPLVLVLGGLLASATGPVEDGVELDPMTRSEAAQHSGSMPE